jgi:hypothetical protein
MLRANMSARTVWVKDLVIEKRQGQNGEYESKSILLNVATDRNYKLDQKQPDGSVKKAVPTDFYLCRAKGEVAQAISDFCTAKNAEGKTISRRLNLFGHMETYKRTQQFTPTANMQFPDGNVYPVTITHEEQIDATIFIIEEFEFLDSNPANKESNTVKQAPVATIGTPINATQVPTTQANPVQVQTPVTQTPVQVTTQQTPAMNPPVNGEVVIQAPVVNTNLTGEECPF